MDLYDMFVDSLSHARLAEVTVRMRGGQAEDG